MRVDKKSRSLNFLIELLLSVLFFAMASMVSVQLFIKSNQSSALAVATSQAVIKSESIAQQLRSYQGNDLAQFLSGVQQGDQVVISLDQNWAKTDKEMAYYQILVTVTQREKNEDSKLILFEVMAQRVQDQVILTQLSSACVWEGQE